jgi:hypothetical protein
MYYLPMALDDPREPWKFETRSFRPDAMATHCKRLLGRLAREARSNGTLAVSEISKGLAIAVIGDMVIADEVGELVSIVALTFGALLYRPRHSSTSGLFGRNAGSA